MTILNKEKILEQARIFIADGKFDRAIREYEKILLADPTDLRVKLRVAELHTRRKQIADAIRIYREVADSYTADGFYLKAVTVHKNILRLNPSLNEINEQLAGLYEKMGLLSDAIRQYDILAAALDLKGMAERVLDIRARIVKLAPRDGAARVRLAELYQREGRVDNAIDQYEEYARQIEESGGDRTKLADIYEKILAYRPERHEMLRKLIGIYHEMGDQKKTLKWLEGGGEFVEQEPELLAMAAHIYASQNQHETARARYMLLADLCRENGDVEGALGAYFEILVLLPDEEERIERCVEETKPGAMSELLGRAQVRRKELEDEETRRQIDEETDRAKKAELEAAAKKGAKAGHKVVASKPEPEKKAAEAPAPKPPKPVQQAPEPRPTAPVERAPDKPAPDRRAGDGAYDLGLVYQRMGLTDEATAEFMKAREIYGAIAETGTPDREVADRLTKIEAILAGEPARQAGHETRDTRPETSDVEKQKAPVSEEEKKTEERKKKVSFV